MLLGNHPKATPGLSRNPAVRSGWIPSNAGMTEAGDRPAEREPPFIPIVIPA